MWLFCWIGLSLAEEPPGGVHVPAPEGAPGGEPHPGPGEGIPSGDPQPSPGSGAGAGPTPPDEGRANRGANFLLAVQDPEGRVAGRPFQARVGNLEEQASFKLLDDGKAPDPIAGDGGYVSAIGDYPGGPVEIALLAGEEELARIAVEVALDMKLPALRATLTPGGVDWKLVSDTAMPGVSGVSIPGTEGVQIQAVAGPERPALQVVAWGLVPGALAGLVLGWLRWGRRRPAQVAPASEPEGERAPRAAIWQARDREQQRRAAAALAERFAAAGPVLLLPRPESRPWMAARLQGQGGILWLEEDRPTPERVVQAAESLSALGEVAVVVEGGGAIEAPGANEPAAAVVEELLEVVDAGVVFLSLAGEPLPKEAERVLGEEEFATA